RSVTRAGRIGVPFDQNAAWDMADVIPLGARTDIDHAGVRQANQETVGFLGSYRTKIAQGLGGSTLLCRGKYIGDVVWHGNRLDGGDRRWETLALGHKSRGTNHFSIARLIDRRARDAAPQGSKV